MLLYAHDDRRTPPIRFDLDFCFSLLSCFSKEQDEISTFPRSQNLPKLVSAFLLLITPCMELPGQLPHVIQAVQRSLVLLMGNEQPSSERVSRLELN